MKLKLQSTSTTFFASLALLVGVFSLLFLPSPATHAAPVTGFNAGNIIGDGVFYNKNAMNVQQIQNFLNGLIPNCDTWGTGVSEYGRGTRAQYAASVGWPAPPYACLNNYHENPSNNETSYERGGGAFPGGISAAQIIYNAAQQYGINPQVLLVMLKKESAGPLTADTWPLKSQYKYAMGYACPDSGPGYSANCQASKAGFYNQMMTAAWQLKYYREHPNDYRYAIGQNQIQYAPDPACGTKSVYIENIATLSLYIYTPYTPNNGALANYPGTAHCGAYGNRNFFMFFREWFGSTQGYMYGTVDYANIFDPTYYATHNPDIAAVYNGDIVGMFHHYLINGLNEGRQANADFNVTSYKNRYADLRSSFGDNLLRYASHYATTGKAEGRVATGDFRGGTTFYNGVDYSSVYSFDYYTRNHPDVWSAFGWNDKAALQHFIVSGLNEGRQGNADFNVASYKNRYADLRASFGDNLLRYASHYAISGKNEGRTATGDVRGGTTLYNGIDYSSVYNFDYYTRNHPDVWSAFGWNDKATLQHFIVNGIKEGRQATIDFNVIAYKNKYADLQASFGDNLLRYASHYATNGKAEGRTAL